MPRASLATWLVLLATAALLLGDAALASEVTGTAAPGVGPGAAAAGHWAGGGISSVLAGLAAAPAPLTTSISVTQSPGVVCPVEASVSSEGTPWDTNVSAVASPSGGTPPYTESWNFGDGSPAAEGMEANHTYFRNGTYIVSVTTTDAVGATAEANASVRVFVENPTCPPFPMAVVPTPYWPFVTVGAAVVVVLVAMVVLVALRRRAE
jgi:hypothetical protein